MCPRCPRVNSLSTLAVFGPRGAAACSRVFGESGDDLGPLTMKKITRLSWVGVDGGLTGPFSKYCLAWLAIGGTCGLGWHLLYIGKMQHNLNLKSSSIYNL